MAIRPKRRSFFLQPYSYQLNPDESVWREVKAHEAGKVPISGQDHRRRFVVWKLHQLQRRPVLPRVLFPTPDLAYIARNQ